MAKTKDKSKKIKKIRLLPVNTTNPSNRVRINPPLGGKGGKKKEKI
jgi:hypothetical protein